MNLGTQMVSVIFFEPEDKRPIKRFSSSSYRGPAVLQSLAGNGGLFGPLIEMTKNSALRGANEALIDLDQKLPKIVCYRVPTKL